MSPREKIERKTLSGLRLFVLICIFSFCLSLPDLSAATQELPFLDSERSISMDLQDASLKDVLKIFSIQSGLNFIASQAVQDRQITLYLDKVPIREAMEKLFKANNLSYDYDEASNIFTVQYWGDLEIETITRIYKLNYRSVASSNLERQKDSLFTSGSEMGIISSSSTAGSGGGGNQESDIVNSLKQVMSKNGSISEDKKTNSLIITDIPSRFPVIEEIIAGLDVPQPQIMLEVEMLDVNKNLIDKLGLNLVNESSPNPFTIIFPGTFSHGEYFVGDLAKRKANLATSGVQGNLVMGATYAALLDLLRQSSDTKYLARPRILTLNNETAEIGVTRDEVVGVKTTRSTDQAGNTTYDTTYERATSLSLTPEGIGIFLKVTPQVNINTGEITMVINPKTSSATQNPLVQNVIALDPEIRTTKSIVKVKDGETIILGGLIHKEKQETISKVPILGDLPILGMFFRHKNVAKDLERELVVFITPYIIYDQNTKLAQGTKAASFYSRPYPSGEPARMQTIDNFLNIFERKKNR
jgi:type II secretory pathway component GspD/PulD (secretin)